MRLPPPVLLCRDECITGRDRIAERNCLSQRGPKRHCCRNGFDRRQRKRFTFVLEGDA